jgi:hypothetical protein
MTGMDDHRLIEVRDADMLVDGDPMQTHALHHITTILNDGYRLDATALREASGSWDAEVGLGDTAGLGSGCRARRAIVPDRLPVGTGPVHRRSGAGRDGRFTLDYKAKPAQTAHPPEAGARDPTRRGATRMTARKSLKRDGRSAR